MKAQLNYLDNLKFECLNREHKMIIDAPSGDNAGPNPKELLLNAMMGCTAMDTVSILKKMRQNIESFQMSIDATKNETHPIHFIKAQIIFDIQGEVADEKAIKAVTKSLTQYCGVNYMVSKTCEIEYIIKNNDQEIYKDIAKFNSPE